MSAPTRSDLARMLTAARSATRPRQVARASRVALIAFVTAVAATALSAHEIYIFPHTSHARTFLGTVDDRVSSRRIGLNDAELHMRGIKSGAMAAALVTAVASGQNLLTNGGFEIGPDQACGWICVGVGSTQIPGWTVTLNSVDRQRTAPPSCQPEGWLAYDGEYSIDLNGCSVGGMIEQVVATEVGKNYRLTVQLTLNPSPFDRGDLRVHTGEISTDFVVLEVVQPIQPWSQVAVEFVATAASTTIRFESLNREYPTQWTGPVIDAADLTVITTPCLGDIDESGAVNDVDITAIFNTWGSDGGKYPRADIDGNGIVDASDLTVVLSSWGACP